MTYKIGNVANQRALWIDGGADVAAYTPSSAGIANLSPQPDEAFSVFFWGRGTTYGGNQFFTGQRNMSSPYEGWDIELENGTGKGQVSIYSEVSGGLRALITKSSDIMVSMYYNGWYHLGFTYSGTGETDSLKLYMNGQDITDTTTLDTGTAAEFIGGAISVQPLWMGFSAWSAGNAYTGCQLGVYSGALNAVQVREIYSGQGNKPGPCDLRNMLGGAVGVSLVGYWLYGNTADTVTTLQDGSGNNFDLTGSSLSAGQLSPVRF